MFEYGKDIPLEEVRMTGSAQQEGTVEKPQTDGKGYSYDHQKAIPMNVTE
ncbi:hypothetical protein [Bacillus sp. REN3]|nr:hypothetical protein [Bacillus sp. REN3]